MRDFDSTAPSESRLMEIEFALARNREPWWEVTRVGSERFPRGHAGHQAAETPPALRRVGTISELQAACSVPLRPGSGHTQGRKQGPPTLVSPSNVPARRGQPLTPPSPRGTAHLQVAPAVPLALLLWNRVEDGEQGLPATPAGQVRPKAVGPGTSQEWHLQFFSFCFK